MAILKAPERTYRVSDREAVIRTLRPLSLRERLATLRSMFDLSQSEAGALVNAKRNTWGNWEAEDDSRRKSYPSRKYRAGLAHTFGLPESLFVEGD